nr:caspase family protein [Mesorhizobium sp.]
MTTASLPMWRMIVRQALAASAACLIVFSGMAAQAQDKALKGIALVVGQSNYSALPALANPVNDARLVSSLLGNLGFEVTTVLDADGTKLSRALRRFAEDAEGSDVALLYFAGHGVEAGGENFLVPVDAQPSEPKDLAAISPLLAELQAAVPVTILLLDACRTNPFPAGARIAVDGSAPVEVSSAGLGALRGVVPMKAAGAANPETLGAVIGFAAEPGKAALDGASGSSPYAAALAKHLPASGFAFGDVMTMVTEEVYLATAARQLPWTNASLRRQLYFGLAPEEKAGDEALIRGERRKLLLTIASTPLETRQLVEQVANTNGVPMDALYGMLDVLGVDVTARSGNLAEQLSQGADRLRQILAERDVQTRQDPDIVRLASLADTAEKEGAIRLALSFRERASQRADQIDASLDEAEANIETRRRELASTFENHAETAILNFDFDTAARRYADAFAQVERYDIGRSYGFKVSEADAWADHGDKTGDNDALKESLVAYKRAYDIGRAAPNSRRDAALRGNMAIVLTILGERTGDERWLQQAIAEYDEVIRQSPRNRVPMDWAYAQLNAGNLYEILGSRGGGAEYLQRALKSFRGAAEVMTRKKMPSQWAGLQMNIGNVEYAIGQSGGDKDNYRRSVAAIRTALQIWTREDEPSEWANAQANLGSSLNALGRATGDTKPIVEGIAAFEAAILVATFEREPVTWARIQQNRASALIELARIDGNAAHYRAAIEGLRLSRRVYTAETYLPAYASTFHEEGRALLYLGILEKSVPILREANAALVTAMSHMRRDASPIDWARARSVQGEILAEIGTIAADKQALRDARQAYEDARTTFRDNGMGETGQGFWEKQIAAIDAQLAAKP